MVTFCCGYGLVASELVSMDWSVVGFSLEVMMSLIGEMIDRDNQNAIHWSCYMYMAVMIFLFSCVGNAHIRLSAVGRGSEVRWRGESASSLGSCQRSLESRSERATRNGRFRSYQGDW